MNCASSAFGGSPKTRTGKKSESSPRSWRHCSMSSLLLNAHFRESMLRTIQAYCAYLDYMHGMFKQRKRQGGCTDRRQEHSQTEKNLQAIA
jgi:hypothetical protein